MPSVIVLTGHPCSGKTTLAGLIRKRVLEHPSRRITNVVILNEASACPDTTLAACYATSAAEKATRGALKAAFDRAVSVATTTSKISTGSSSSNDATLIILDSTNYIKGYRYELYCISKASSCSHCVVWCLNSVDTVVEWNTARRLQDNHPDAFYSDELLQALILRYEPPDERNRWDKPLFRIDMRPTTIEATSTVSSDAASAGRQVLDQSVYNMHNLAETMGGTTIATAATSNLPSSDTPKKASLFKRSSTFKKRERVKESNATSIVALTAESLSMLSVSHSKLANDTLNPIDSSRVVTSSVEPARLNVDDSATPRDAPVEAMPLEQRIDKFLQAFLFSNQTLHQLRQGTSTRQHVATDSDVLHKVDSVTQQVCASIQTASNTVWPHWAAVGGDADWFVDQCVAWQSRATAADLRRVRQQYIQWIATHPPESNEDEVGDAGHVERRIARSFLDYIESSLQTPTR